MKEFRDLMVDSYDKANIVLYGVPFDCNCSIGIGASEAPNKMRELSWWLPPYSMDGKPLSNIRIFDAGDVESHSFLDICNNSNIFKDNKFKLIFGGDHSISIPFQKEFIKSTKKNGKIPALVHIDAHCDICDIYLGSKYSHACTVRRAIDNGLLDENLFMIGIREFEKDGYDYLIKRDNDVHLYLATDILNNGIDYVLDDVIRFLNDDKFLIYVSFDIDSLDASYAPGTGTPETCGLSPNDLRKLLKALGGLKNVRCLDIVEVSPPLDSDDITSWCAIKLLYEFLASLRIS